MLIVLLERLTEGKIKFSFSIMILALFFILFILVTFARIIYVFVMTKKDLSKQSARTLIVLGSGGHTAELIRQVLHIDPVFYKPRLYVVSDDDSSSKSKIKNVESRFKGQNDINYFVKEIPRSRKVGQSYITSILTTIYSTVACIPIVFSFKPDLLLCNGPGTCIPICVVVFFMNFICISNTRIVFIESICRVKTLSLSAKLLLPFADKILVQWFELKTKYPQTEFIGRLM